MIFLTENLPNLNNHIKGNVHVSSNAVKIGRFKSHKKKLKILNGLKLQAKARATIQAEYKYNANALIDAACNIQSKGTMYRALMTGKAIATNVLENRNTVVDKYLSSLGLTGFYTAPITDKLDSQVAQVLRKKYPVLYSKGMKDGASSKKVKSHLSNLLNNSVYFKKAHLFVYHHPTVATAVAEDIFGLGIVGRLLHIYPGLVSITIANNHLSYKQGPNVYNYGNKFNENPKAITHAYIIRLANVLTHHKLPTSMNPKKRLMFGLLLVDITYIAPNHYSLTITNTALRRIIIAHPTVRNITVSQNTIVGNYNFRRVKGYLYTYHNTFRVSNDSTIKRQFNKEFLKELSQVCLHNKSGNYADVIGDISITHSQYAGCNVSLVESTKNDSPSIVLLSRPNIKMKIVTPKNHSVKPHIKKHMPMNKSNKSSINASHKPHVTIYTPAPQHHYR